MITRKRWSESENDKLREAFLKHPKNKEVAISTAANALKRTEAAVNVQWRRLNGEPVKMTAIPPKSTVSNTNLLATLVVHVMKSITPNSVITISKGEATIKF